jgi:hypothetical protein
MITIRALVAVLAALTGAESDAKATLAPARAKKSRRVGLLSDFMLSSTQGRVGCPIEITQSRHETSFSALIWIKSSMFIRLLDEA